MLPLSMVMDACCTVGRGSPFRRKRLYNDEPLLTPKSWEHVTFATGTYMHATSTGFYFWSHLDLDDLQHRHFNLLLSRQNVQPDKVTHDGAR